MKYVREVRRLRRNGYVWIDALEDAWYWAYKRK